MAIRQARIFVPSNEPEDNWAETVLGRVIQPLVTIHSDGLQWFWFTRYAVYLGQDEGDCDINLLPKEYIQPRSGKKTQFHRSIRFRFDISEEKQDSFETNLKKTWDKHRYFVPGGVIDYGMPGDLGNDRHVGNEHREPQRREERAQLVVQFYMSISRIVLDALDGPDKDNRYRSEHNDNEENPHGSTFETLHHIFCNTTDVPTFARVSIGTDWSTTYVQEFPVTF